MLSGIFLRKGLNRFLVIARQVKLAGSLAFPRHLTKKTHTGVQVQTRCILEAARADGIPSLLTGFS
jgi:hypothetical protein